MSAIELLCALIAQGGQARAAFFRERPGYSTLLEGGLLREAGVVQSLMCEDCSTPHDAEVTFEDGHYGIFCPEFGFVPTAREEITAVVPDVPRLVTALAVAFGCTHRKSTPLHDGTWRIGAVTMHDARMMLYFHPRLASEQDIFDLRAGLSKESRSPFWLVLTAQGALPVPGATTAPLTEVVEIEPSSGTVAPTCDLFSIVGAPIRRAGGAPNVHGDTLRGVIRSRIESGAALEGRNEEARAILYVLRGRTSDAEPPSLPTIKRYLSDERGGS